MDRPRQREEAFSEQDVDEVLMSVTRSVEPEVRKQITSVVDKAIRDVLFGVVNMTKLGSMGAPQVMLRVRTFQTILDDFRNELGEQYDNVLGRIGRNIGFNFGLALTRILRQSERIPLTYKALFDFWARFDSAAQMGEFAFDLHDSVAEPYVDVRIKDLFLTHGYGNDNPLRHSPFIEGYLEAALDSACFLWTRWIRKSIYEKPTHLFCAAGCVPMGTDAEAVSKFRIRLQEETHPDLKNILAAGVESCSQSNWTDAVVTGRIALERGAMLLAGEKDPNLKVSFGRLLSALQSVRVAIDYNRWNRAYENCSNYAHRIQLANEVAVSTILFDIWRCLYEVQMIPVSGDLQREIQKGRQRYVTP